MRVRCWPSGFKTVTSRHWHYGTNIRTAEVIGKVLIKALGAVHVLV
jgi:hypothetical protein